MSLSDALSLLVVATIIAAIFLARRKANARLAAALSAAFAKGEASARAAASAAARVDLGGIHFGHGQRTYSDRSDYDGINGSADYDRGGPDHLGPFDARGLPGPDDSGVSPGGLRAVEAANERTFIGRGAAVDGGVPADNGPDVLGSSGLMMCPYCFAPFNSRNRLTTHVHVAHSEKVPMDDHEARYFDIGERRRVD